MNLKRHLPDSLSLGHQRETFNSRNLPIQLFETPRKISKGEKVSRSLASRFAEEQDRGLSLSDEIPTQALSYIVGESRALLSSTGLTQANWDALSEFLATELLDFIDLKQQMNAAQRECEEWLKVAEEVCDPANGGVSPNRILEVALSLQEAKMRRKNLRARVKLVIDELSAEILDGISSVDRDSLEIRLRGGLGKLS